MARGPNVRMREPVNLDLSDGSNFGTCFKSFARIAACVSAASAISLNSLALPGSRSAAATAPER